MAQKDLKTDIIAAPSAHKLEKNNKLAPSDDGASELMTDDGRTIIHNEVVSKIAGMAVREVDGVRSLVPFDAGQSVSRLASRLTGKTLRDLGVHVEVGKVEAAVDVRIVVDFGTNIVQVAQSIRDNLKARIEGTTGLKVIEVNVEVVDLYFPEEEDQEEQTEHRVR